MLPTHPEIIICGAGIAGIATAYQLTVKHGLRHVVLVDNRPPLTLTSDKSTECYRNWWPGPDPTMLHFMNRSIDLLEALADESHNYFHLNRRGYVYLTADPTQLAQLEATAVTLSQSGAGPLRYHTTPPTQTTYQPAPAHGYHQQPTGADLLLNHDLIRQQFPFAPPHTIAALHARRCGWLSAQQLGMYLLQQAKAHGLTLIRGQIIGLETQNGRIHTVHIHQHHQLTELHTPTFINAAGPLLHPIGQLLGLDLPIYNELHGKLALEDTHHLIPRHTPLMIWPDPITLPWSEAEKADLYSQPETQWLCDPLPGGAHFRPEGGPGSHTLILLWPYHTPIQTPTWPTQFPPEYAEILLRGLTRLAPALATYVPHPGKPTLDGGYYCKTAENRPLIGPLPIPGAYIIGALSGYGIMAAMAASELLAAHITHTPLPHYAPAFHPQRYTDPTSQTQIATHSALDGQL